MKYSIIVPVYNRPDEVDELLASLLHQEEKDFEVADHIRLTVWGGEDLRKAVDAFGSYISEETLSNTLDFAENDGDKAEIGDEEVFVRIVKA